MIEKENKKNKVSISSGAPRRKIRSFVTRRKAIATMFAILVAIPSFWSFWFFAPEDLRRIMVSVKWEIISTTVRLGFRVEDILVVGRRETSRKELLEAVRLSQGAPIFAFDIEAARSRVESLSWVRSARVERILPDTILLKVDERQPLAVWQHQGEFALIDRDGIVILRSGLERFSDLVVVVGAGAEKRAAVLLETLEHEPELKDLVEAAIWVGGRRWNVRLKGNINVRLPEKNAEGAWARLAKYEREHSILKRDVQVLDLRLPDRLIVRKTPKSNPIQKNSERET